MTQSGNAEFWFVQKHGIRLGPVSLETIANWVREGTLRFTDLVSRTGSAEWIQAASIVGPAVPGDGIARPENTIGPKSLSDNTVHGDPPMLSNEHWLPGTTSRYVTWSLGPTGQPKSVKTALMILIVLL